MYLSCLLDSPKYVEEGELVMFSPARVIFDLVDVPLKIAYSVFEVLIRRSYYLAQIST